jgi:hypothetical protein
VRKKFAGRQGILLMFFVEGAVRGHLPHDSAEAALVRGLLRRLLLSSVYKLREAALS